MGMAWLTSQRHMWRGCRSNTEMISVPQIARRTGSWRNRWASDSHSLLTRPIRKPRPREPQILGSGSRGGSWGTPSTSCFLSIIFFFYWSIISWYVVLVSSLEQSDSDIYIYIYLYIYILFQILFIISYCKTLNIVPRRPLLLTYFIYFIYSSKYLLIPNSKFISPPTPAIPVGNHKFVWQTVFLSALCTNTGGVPVMSWATHRAYPPQQCAKSCF